MNGSLLCFQKGTFEAIHFPHDQTKTGRADIHPLNLIHRYEVVFVRSFGFLEVSLDFSFVSRLNLFLRCVHQFSELGALNFKKMPKSHTFY